MARRDGGMRDKEREWKRKSERERGRVKRRV